MLLALLVRGGAGYAMRNDLAADPDGYRGIAQLLLETGEYRRPVAYQLPGDAALDPAAATIPTAYRPPLYPLLLAALAWGGEVTDLAAASLNLVLGVATVWCVWRLAIRWQLGRWSLAAALLVAVDPILLRQAALVMTETLAALLAVLALLALTRYGERRDWRSAGLAGLVLGLACLCRPTFLPWTALAAGAIAIAALRARGGAEQPRPKLGHAAALALAALLALLPWGVRNYARFGEPILTTSHGGYTLLLGNNPEFYRYLRENRSGELWDAEQSQMADEYRRAERRHAGDELAVDRWANRRAKQHMVENPAQFAYASLVRVGRFWQLMPHRLSASESTARFLARLAIALWYAVLFGAAIVGCLALRGRLLRSPWLWGLLLAASLTALHAVYWSNMRMRAPVSPVVALLAAAGGAAIWRRSPGRIE